MNGDIMKEDTPAVLLVEPSQESLTVATADHYGDAVEFLVTWMEHVARHRSVPAMLVERRLQRGRDRIGASTFDLIAVKEVDDFAILEQRDRG